MRTQCSHCQAKFKAPDGAKGKKVNCPKCNQPFVISPLIKDNILEVCSNCDKEIAQLEQTCVFNGKIVCAECNKKLRSDSKPEASDLAELDVAAVAESSYEASDEITDAELCEILGVNDAVVASEGSLPKSPLRGGNDMGTMRCGQCGKQMTEEDKANGCEDLDVIICKDCNKEISNMVASVKRQVNSPFYSIGGPIGVIFVVLMLFIGIPMFRAWLHDVSNRSRRAADEKQRSLIDEDDLNAIDYLPQDGVYSASQGKGGSYKDPINGFFVVQAPAGFEIKKRLDKTKFVINEGSSHVGETVPQSFIQFIYANKIFIAVIARKTFTTIEHDFDAALDGLPKKFSGIKIHRDRFVTIDGVKGGEVLASWRGQKLLIVKYKKYGLDHAITVNCDEGDFPKFEDKFVAFLRSYRSLESEQDIKQADGE